MKNYLFAFSALAILFFGINKIELFNNDSKDKEAVIIESVTNFMMVNHYKPSEINDEFSETVFKKYIEFLDGNKRYFIQKDIDSLEKHKYLIDDYIKEKKIDLLDDSDRMAEKAIKRAEGVFQGLKDYDFNYEKVETIELDREKKDYPKDEKALEDRWRRIIKFEILNRYENLLKSNEKIHPDSTAKTTTEMHQEAKEAALKSIDSWFTRLNQIRRSDRFDFYMNAITHTFDPHTDYFTPKSKEDFDVRFSGRLEGIGARLSSVDGLTKVVSIVPGGPAWKGKELENGDMITKVAQEGEEPVSVDGMRLDDVVSKIRGKKGTKVILTVKKKDNSIKVIEIIRDVIIMEEGNAKSAIVEVDNNNHKVGYVNLPSFYADFNDKNGRNSYRDVEKELKKLKEENVDGIILDLRYNGGGSLQDVVKIGGLFIEKGPIVQVKSKNRPAYVYDDKDSKVQYDGPLVILVNEASASASEILAAAMQDYKRAVIVGSTSTFGKGTVQRFYDLDRFQFLNEYKPLGQVKVTVQKFFRINGGSTQLKGVESDIVLPDSYQYIKTGEEDYDQALPWDEIESVDYDQDVYKIDHLDKIKANSKFRVDSNVWFNKIEKRAQLISKNKDESSYSLNLEEFVEKQRELEKASDLYEDVGKDSLQGITIYNLDVDQSYIEQDSSRMARNSDFISKLHKDVYLQEAMFIMDDIIRFKE